MPLHIDRASIAARQHERAQHEVALDRAAQRTGGDAGAAAALAVVAEAPETDVAVDVRGLGAATWNEELAQVDRAEQVARTVRSANIAALAGAHTGLDANRAAALLRD